MMQSALRIVLTAFISLSANIIFAQEVLMPLETNPLLENSQAGSKKHSKHGEPHVQKLPFFDDFSNYDGLYPNDTMWLDKDAYISRTMAVSPPSVGTVVLEGLNEFGRPYRGIEDVASYPSDTLTSTYIDLSPFDNGDSLYLSFFYQPRGLGDAPEPGDSLVVELGDSTSWFRVWSVQGSNLADFQVAMIPIKAVTGRNYFNAKFQFRFISYSSQSGNLDHWLVDYVYLNQGRERNENTFDDVAVYKESRSILNTYYSMPVRQADAMSDPFNDNVSIYATNNSGIVKNVAFGYQVSLAGTGTVIDSNANIQSDNLNPGQHREFTIKHQLTDNDLNGTHLKWLVKTYAKNPTDDFRGNDTAIHIQEFGDYLAYDDGTAENSFGLINVTQGKVAVRYILPQADTLYGFAIHFTFGVKDVSSRRFTLAVWDKITPTGQPENDDPIRKINFVFPQYTNRINGYHYFKLELPLAVKDQFYVGWIQNQDFMLNVGADLNYADLSGSSNNPNLFVSTLGEWYNSSLNFAPMIRPYLGTDFVAGIPVVNARPELQVRVYPNPSSGVLHVETDPSLKVEAALFSIDGRQLSGITEYRGVTTLNFPDLKPGLYLLRLSANNGFVRHEKIMVR